MKKKTLKKKLELIPLTRDFMFKRVFSLNQDLLKKFLISVLKLDINPDMVNLELNSNELTKEKEKEYHKTVDILVTFSNKFRDSFITIDVELNSSRPEDINFRNYLYINKITNDEIKKGTDIKEYEKYLFLQLNLNIHKFKDNVGEKIYSMKEEKTLEEFVSNVKIISKSLDYYYDFYYTNNKLVSNDVIWLALLNSKDFRELEEMSDLIMSKKEKEKFVKTCKDTSRDELFLSEWEADKMAAMVKRITIENAKKDGINEGREEGIKEGREEGIREGIKEGIKEKTDEMIKSMLKKGISLSDISDISGMSIDYINSLNKNNN